MNEYSETDESFWMWFSAYAEEVKRAYQEGDHSWLDDQLTRWLSKVGDDLGWEIGPYHDGFDTLVISPKTRSNLPLTKRIVATAPAIDGWKFEPAKPPKKVQKLEITLDGFTNPADQWAYRMTSFNSGEFVDIEIFIPKDVPFDERRSPTICALIVETLIGEELFLERVGRLAHQRVDDVAAIDRVTPMKHLYDHLDSALS